MTESYRLPQEAQQEAIPSLPIDPTEAAAWLEEIWKGSGGWESLHPVRSKVREPGDYQTLSEDEKAQFDKLGGQFRWLAEMYRSELAWSQSYARTNHGEVIAFRFGYEKLDNPEHNVPEAYVYRPFGEEEAELFISKSRDGWKIEPLSEVAANYTKQFEY